MTVYSSERLSPASPPTQLQQSKLPRHWNPNDKHKSLVLSGDFLCVRYGGGTSLSSSKALRSLNKHANKDAAAVRANMPIPRECAVYYFEVKVRARDSAK